MDIKRIYEVITIIKKAKYKAYLVGGSSRDFLYARNFTDVDIATNAPLDYISKTFNVINDQGKSMGSLKINYKNGGVNNGRNKIRAVIFSADGDSFKRIEKSLSCKKIEKSGTERQTGGRADIFIHIIRRQNSAQET